MNEAGTMKLENYETTGFYDELIEADGQPRDGASLLMKRIQSLAGGELERRQRAANIAFLELGITFNVYGEEEGTEKIFPFDIIPRIIEKDDWSKIEEGLKQRITALNLFLDDIYNEQKILKDGIIPEDMVLTSKGYLEQCKGLKPPKGIWCHITGTDLIRDNDGEYKVLEDNMRCPSGASYVLENRQILKRTFPIVFEASRVRGVDHYPYQLRETLQHLAPEHVYNPTVVVLTPGIYNSAYFEHSFLAQQMGVQLVEGRDLLVKDGLVHMRTTKGYERVDVIYRRIDDNFIDPEAFNPDSLLGVPGIMEVYKQGRVALANAPGTGVADDKAVYAYVPRIIKYYLDQEMILPNIKTYICSEEDDLKYVLENLDQLVVKAVDESGGYGMMIGPKVDSKTHAEFAEKIKANPRNYIAQPTLCFSRAPVIVDDHFEGRHVDLRPYILYGDDIRILPGGLTRVALKKRFACSKLLPRRRK